MESIWMFIPERDLLCIRPDLSTCPLRDFSAAEELVLVVEPPEAFELGIFAIIILNIQY
jgi:hypothetical protein